VKQRLPVNAVLVRLFGSPPPLRLRVAGRTMPGLRPGPMVGLVFAIAGLVLPSGPAKLGCSIVLIVLCLVTAVVNGYQLLTKGRHRSPAT
jgi:hypothetical protein